MRLAAYLDLHDIKDDVFESETIPMLERAGVTVPLVPVEGLPFDAPHGPVTPIVEVARVVALCTRLRELGMEPIAWTFPDVAGDLLAALQHLAACCAAAGVRGQLDAEPFRGAHWTPTLLGPWLAQLPGPSITTTRAELPKMGPLPADCDLWLQLEAASAPGAPGSTDTLDAALAIAARWATLDLVVPVIGVFDTGGVPRMLEQIRTDLERCTPQAMRSSTMSFWNAHTLTTSKADAIRAWLDASNGTSDGTRTSA